MNNNPEINGERRALLKSGVRLFILSGIVLICGLLGKRKSSSAGEKVICEIDLPCRKCSQVGSCTISYD